MTECLVDVLNGRDTVLHVFPVPVKAEGPAREAECVREALQAASRLQLVPESEASGLHARVHVGRGGQLTPFGDVLEVRQQARERVRQRVRLRAYFLWENEGRPENRAMEHWLQACRIEIGGCVA